MRRKNTFYFCFVKQKYCFFYVFFCWSPFRNRGEALWELANSRYFGWTKHAAASERPQTSLRANHAQQPPKQGLFPRAKSLFQLSSCCSSAVLYYFLNFLFKKVCFFWQCLVVIVRKVTSINVYFQLHFNISISFKDFY